MSTHERAVRRIYQDQYRALMRLQVYALGETHAIFGAVAREIAAVVAGRREGEVFGPGDMVRARPTVDKLWSAAHQRYATLLYAALEQAARIAFGGLVRMHRLYFFGSAAIEPAESVSVAAPRKTFTEAAVADDFVFSPQLKALLDAAERRIVGGMRLSDRVWKLDQESRRGIEQALMNAIVKKQSAWDAAKAVEQFLGAGQDCPRWTRTRLGLTKKDIAGGDRRGLKSGDECAGQGVSYNALRLMRTEIQAIHNAATQDLMKMQPWVKEEQMFLSPAHPQQDICDEIIAKGKSGQGIYPKGTLRLPIHPNCLCGLRAVVSQSPDEFVSQLRGWMRGETDWPEMDAYERLFNGWAMRDSDPGVSIPEWGFASAMLKRERAHAHDPREHAWIWDQDGNLLFETTGQEFTVNLAGQKIAGNIVSHTHRWVRPFSEEDVLLLAEHKAAELRVADAAFVYRMRLDPRVSTEQLLQVKREAYDQVVDSLVQLWHDDFLTDEAFQQATLHQLWLAVTRRLRDMGYSASYLRAPWEP